jgi:hypothetical protein
MKILWIDPGGTTGWASYRCEEITTSFGTEYFEEQWLTGEIKGDDLHEKVKHLIELHHDEMNYTLGYESWQLRKKNGETLDNMDFRALEYIGVIKLTWMEDSKVESWDGRFPYPIVSQTPSERKFADKRKLDVFDLWSLTSGQKDARAAAQHLLTYLIKAKQYPPIMKKLEAALR